MNTPATAECSPMPVLDVAKLTTGYGKRRVLDGISVTIRQREIVEIRGSNGCGKSTLFRAIVGMVPTWTNESSIRAYSPLNNGWVEVGGTANCRRHGIGYLPQRSAVFADLTLEENLAVAGESLGSRHPHGSELEELLEFLPRLRAMRRRLARSLSGGEQQILALTMILLGRPRILLLDEPIAGLDSKSVESITAMILSARSRSSMAVVFSEHRPWTLREALARLYYLRGGKLEQDTDGRLGDSV